jgi:dTDP-4-amino-4,6-dideoxygalactose transaminase
MESKAQAVPFLDLQRQYKQLRPRLLEAVTAALDSGQWILGASAAEFERAAAPLCGAKFAVGCANGTDALWLALVAAGVQPGMRVLTTPFSFFATASSILRAGAVPVFADIDPVTFNLSAESAAEAIERQAKKGEPVRAMMPVHLYGQCADMDALGALAAKHGLIVIEDAAQAIGATWQGRAAGSLGAAAGFSFYPTKNLGAMGDAGMVTTNDEEIAVRLRMLREHGMRKRYHHEVLGANSRLDAVQAATLRVKLEFVAEWNALRVQHATRYDELFVSAGVAGDPVVLPARDVRAGHVFHQYVVRVERRDALREHLTARGVGSEIFYPIPLHRQQALEFLGYAEGSLPESERASREVLALPMYAELREDEQERVVATIAEFYR